MFKGYIEGYYSRRLPIDAFKDLKTPISHYFYGPKEDMYLRHRWKELDKNVKRRILPKKIKQVYCVSPTSEFFEDLSKGNGPKNSILALGYAGWGPGQIEKELASNSWMTLKTNSDFIFDEKVNNKWNDAFNLLGIDASRLSIFSGSC